jgi:hypothetical protein
MKVYEEDTVCDHRMAVDIFDNIAIPNRNKEFYAVFSDQADSLGYRLSADHFTPTGGDDIGFSVGVVDGLDFYGVWRSLDAICDNVINGSKKDGRIALGSGKKQSYMGQWPKPEDRDVKRMMVSDDPDPLQPQGYYLWPWRSIINPRR